MSEREWLESLKAGDEVLVCRGTYDQQLRRVERVTARQIVLPHDTRFRRKDGNEVGGHRWLGAWIRKPTDDDRLQASAKLLKQALASRVEKIDPRNATARQVALLDSAYKALIEATKEDGDE